MRRRLALSPVAADALSLPPPARPPTAGTWCARHVRDGLRKPRQVLGEGLSCNWHCFLMVPLNCLDVDRTGAAARTPSLVRTQAWALMVWPWAAPSLPDAPLQGPDEVLVGASLGLPRVIAPHILPSVGHNFFF